MFTERDMVRLKERRRKTVGDLFISLVLSLVLFLSPPGSLMGDPVVMLSLYPEFPKDVMSSMTSHGEFLFVVDRSGSMECPMHLGSGSQDRIGSARVHTHTQPYSSE